MTLKDKPPSLTLKTGAVQPVVVKEDAVVYLVMEEEGAETNSLNIKEEPEEDMKDHVIPESVNMDTTYMFQVCFHF